MRVPAADAMASPSPELARIVHDLHGPLTVIRGLCATLTRDEARPARLRAIELIDEETMRLAAGLAGLARVGALDGRSFAVRLDLAALVAGIAERFCAIAESHGLRLVARGTDLPVWIEGDGALLERLIENLLRNAFRHCATRGCVELTVAERGDLALVKVRDDGPGVPVHDRERIFRAGERGSGSRGEGRGLGLAIAREIASVHGGGLTLDPVGEGACFRLSLPIAHRIERGPGAA